MDIPDNILNIKVWSLRESVHPEDKELIELYEIVLKTILAHLKPILRYVCTPQKFFGSFEFRCLPVGAYPGWHSWEQDTPNHVFLSETGAFFEAKKRAIGLATESDLLVILATGSSTNWEKVNERIRDGQSDPFCTWNQLPFIDLINSLSTSLAEAESKKTEHLKMVTARKQLLEKILGMATKSASTEQEKETVTDESKK